ncbi:tyrosine-type recombinase/integrase [Bradyrhizobium sp. SZCCHNS3053]|uniref:tyrosine-type recombinase/integrase n=1 Tax=Bradyrhizobium sp. SZCCHNS3053 TaxID=3057322 RepID=UPI002915C496|nr:integrase arm-type DNA-binding domain-containing protein [Bradyrhizobium sp. SZCCHNS3053]
MPKLTDKLITGLKCPQGKDQVDVSDEACPGLKVRVFQSGAKSFAFTYWSPLLSRAVRISLGRYPDISLSLAREKAAEQRKKIGEDKDPRSEQRRERRAAARAEDLSFEALCDAYLEEYAKPNKASWKNDEGYLKRPKVALGHMPAHTVTDDDIADILDEIAENAPVSANRTQSVIHKMFEWARQPGRKYVPSNPITGMSRRGGTEKPKNRVLSDKEIKTLWWGLDREDLGVERSIRLALKLILVTMVRPGQSAGALVPEFQGLDCDDPLWFIPEERVKKDRPVIVPLNPLAEHIVKEAIKDDKQMVLFPSRFSEKAEVSRHSLSQALNDRNDGRVKGIRSILGIDHFTPHDLRRTAATVSRRGGANRDHVKKMLDHMEGDVTSIYDQYDMLPEKRLVAQILGKELKRIIGEKNDTHADHRPVAAVAGDARNGRDALPDPEPRRP